MSVRISAESLTAKELSRRIGDISPARRVEAGDPISPRSPGLHMRAFCIYESPLSSESTPEEHLAWAIKFVEGTQEPLSTVLPEIDLRLSLSTTEQCCFALTPAELSFLGAQGVQINIDIYPSDSE